MRQMLKLNKLTVMTLEFFYQRRYSTLVHYHKPELIFSGRHHSLCPVFSNIIQIIYKEYGSNYSVIRFILFHIFFIEFSDKRVAFKRFAFLSYCEELT